MGSFKHAFLTTGCPVKVSISLFSSWIWFFCPLCCTVYSYFWLIFLSAGLALIKAKGTDFPGISCIVGYNLPSHFWQGEKKVLIFFTLKHTYMHSHTWFAGFVDSTEQLYAALVSPVMEDSANNIEVSCRQIIFEEVPLKHTQIHWISRKLSKSTTFTPLSWRPSIVWSNAHCLLPLTPEL